MLVPFDANAQEEELYKAAKLETDDDVKSKGKAPMVEDEEDDGEAGPELPPDFDQEDVPDDEEGRFFGGGMERQTAEAMQYIDYQDAEEGQEAVRVKKAGYVDAPKTNAYIDLAREIRCRLGSTVCAQFRKEDIQEC